MDPRTLRYASGSTSLPLMLMHAEAHEQIVLHPPPKASGAAWPALVASPAT
jgi:hypothetical protein